MANEGATGDRSLGSGVQAARTAFALIFIGTIANGVIATWAYGPDAAINFVRYDWLADFLKHVMSFPGPPLHSSIFEPLLHHFRISFFVTDARITHFHNMPLTVLISLGWRPLFSLMDPAILYFILAGCFIVAWLVVACRYADRAARPAVLAFALFNYPMIALLDRGNLFAGLSAVCLAAMLCRRKMDWTAVMLLVVAANVRPNILMLALPVMLSEKGTIPFVVKTGIIGIIVAVGSLLIDGLIYPAYTLPAVLRGLALYNQTYVLGSFGLFYVSSLWGAVRHFVPVVGWAASACTLVGLLPLLLAWLKRDRLSYAAICFLAISASTLSTSVLADYHLLIFVVPIILLRRDDPAFWPVLLASCWMLIPKHYNPAEVLSWQTYLNPAGLVLATALVAWSGSSRRRDEAALAPSIA